MTETIQQFDMSVNLLQALLWQYETAENLKALLQQKSAWYDVNQTEFWNNWYTDVFDLRTANDFGLTVWSIILGQPIYVNFGLNDRPTWGFGEFHRNFTRGNFSSFTDGNSTRLSTETSRILLRIRYYQLTGAGCVPEINRMIADVFADYAVNGNPPGFLTDLHDMTQMYTFQFPLPSDLAFVFNNFDVLPRPAGVGSAYRVIVNESWGFDAYHENFDNGNFSEG